MRRKTPQEKKAESYVKERRNIYGQNDKASRKLIPLRKAQVNRVYRRKIGEILGQTERIDVETADSVDSSVKNVRRVFWKKHADERLGKVITRQFERRESHAGNGKTARKKVREFIRTLQFDTEQETDGRWIADATGMNGVMRYGDTEQDAVQSCRSLARLVFLEQLGAIEILSVTECGTSIRSK